MEPKKDPQWVTPEGKPVAPLIHGVVLRAATTQTDDRGTLCEIFCPAWGLHPDPIVYVYQFTVRPGKIKGWHIHHEHDDRIFLSQGTVRTVLYDTRTTSPTYQMVNEIYLSEHHRSLLIIPAYVYHAFQNVDTRDALLVSLPNRAYNHADPDVYRLPIENDVIPFKFDSRAGW